MSRENWNNKDVLNFSTRKGYFSQKTVKLSSMYLALKEENVLLRGNNTMFA